MNAKNNDIKPKALLSPTLNMAPPLPMHIHLMGICGSGMASLAGILKKRGFSVSGSDENIYPPMSHFLRDLEITVQEGYGPKNLNPVPDLVIVGNVITRYNTEAIEISRLNIPYLSLPQALRNFAMKDAKSIVVSGTHGKTTTSAIASWVLEKSGMDPGFMIGGILNNFQGNFKLGDGPYFVIEGDEYDTAFFDKRSKFLHYDPWILILTSIEFDHADIFRDLNQVIESFRQVIDLIPQGGLLIANNDDPIIKAEFGRAKCPIITYGLSQGAQWRAEEVRNHVGSTHLKILFGEREHLELSTSLYGQHNISNLLSIVALAEYLKIDRRILSEAIGSFSGVKRRQEIKGEKKGIVILDDFAHHPTAVQKTVQAVKERYGDRRLIAVFEPRSNSSRRNIFQERYSSSFFHADLVLIPEPPMLEKIPPLERFSSSRLVENLNKSGLKAFYCLDTNDLLHEILNQVQEGDVILIMSNGSFDNLINRLLESI